MTAPPLQRIIGLIGLTLVATAASAQPDIYCWTDDNGRLHCADNVPPDQAKHDRNIVNTQGVVIGTEEGEITEEERRAMAEREAAERLAREEAERQRQFDQFLLDNYLSVAAIERVRDRNLEVYDSQERIMDIYLRNLKKKLGDLLEDAERFAPYNAEDGAPQIPVNLADDIANTESSIDVREQMLDEIRSNRRDIADEFNRQIERFRVIQPSSASPGVPESAGAANTLGEFADDR